MPDIQTTTFFFTDVEGSTRLWAEHREAMGSTIARHYELLRAAVEDRGGTVFKTVGDAVCAAFPTPGDALRAAIAGQRAMATESWTDVPPLRVRMAIHTGVAELIEGDWLGQPLNRVARLLAIGHGGQVLVSRATKELVADDLPAGVGLRDLGDHRLKDLTRPERVYQLVAPDLPEDFPTLQSLDYLPTNLPPQLTSFVGRAAELASLADLIAGHRLVTVTGTGGSGKSRLALQAAASQLDHFPDGVWFVDLAPLETPAVVPDTVAAVLGVQPEPSAPTDRSVAGFLSDRSMLILLDNCEHLLEAVAALVTQLLQAAPGLRVVASSREALGVVGEQVMPLAPLTVPDAARWATLPQAPSPTELRTLAQVDAVRLFLERAHAVRPDFAVTDANAAAIASLCLHLDGIPLALELAAARVRNIPVDQLAARLSDRFRVLTSNVRGTVPRQQTLRATIDWSHDQLDPPEQALFRRLAVFRGGWTLEAAEAVCADEPGTAAAALDTLDVTDLLPHLVDKSMVVLDMTPDGSGRYRYLETLREYATERLMSGTDARAVFARHTAFFVAMADAADAGLTGPEQDAWRSRLAQERGNIRAMLKRELRPDGNAAMAVRAVVGIWRFGHGSQYHREFVDWCSRAYEQRATADPATAAMATYALGAFLRGAGESEVARLRFGEAATAFEANGDLLHLSWALNDLGQIHVQEGQFEAAEAMIRRSLELKEQVAPAWDQAIAMAILGTLHESRGDLTAARSWYARARDRFDQEAGGPASLRLTIRLNLADIDLQLGHADRAATSVRHDAPAALAVGAEGLAAALCARMGWLAADAGKDRRAALLMLAAEAQCIETGSGIAVPESLHTVPREAVRERLGEAIWAEISAQATTLTIEALVTLATRPDEDAVADEPGVGDNSVAHGQRAQPRA